MQVTDRMALTAILNAIIAVGEKVTDKKMTVTIRDEDGNYIKCTGDNVDFS